MTDAKLDRARALRYECRSSEALALYDEIIAATTPPHSLADCTAAARAYEGKACALCSLRQFDEAQVCGI